MTPEKQKELAKHVEAIAKILYEETESKDLASLAKIEQTVREPTLKHITPQIVFFIKEITGIKAGRIRKLKSIIGQLPLSEKQARILQLKPHCRISPYLEECCLRVSANVFYKNAAQDVERYIGIKVSEKTQQRARSSP